MRHEHKELIREEMHSSDKYCHDLASLSISDIFTLIEYNTRILEDAGSSADSPRFKIYHNNLTELNEYMNEFNIRLSNRTFGFKKHFHLLNKEHAKEQETKQEKEKNNISNIENQEQKPELTRFEQAKLNREAKKRTRK